MNATSKRNIIRLYAAISAKIEELDAECDALEYGSWERTEKQERIRALQNQRTGINCVLALIAPERGCMKGFGLIIKGGEMRQRIGALSVDDLISHI